MPTISCKPAILGGTPVRTRPFAPRVTMSQAEQQAVREVLESDVLSAFIGASGKFFNGGRRVTDFEAIWCQRLGFKHAVSVNSWTSGLVTAVGAIGIEPGDEIICPPYTMSASATCCLFYGGIPVFADIDPETFCISAKSIAGRITPRTKAIMVVHLFGHPADMDEIMALARKHNLKVIEDAAQAPGVLYKGRPVGAIGDLGGFSLNFHKHIHTGEGGVIVTNDDDLAHRCRLIRNHGENVVTGDDPAELVNCIGNNYRLTEVQAAIGSAQMSKLDACLSTRAGLAEHLRRRIDKLPGLRAQAHPADGSTHAYYLLPVHFNARQAGLSRHQFVKAVLAELPKPEGFEGTALTEGYVKPLYLSPVYQKRIAIGSKGFPFHLAPAGWPDYSAGSCPVTEHMYQNELLLCPVVREPLTTADMDDVASAMERVLEHAAEISRNVPDSATLFTPVAAAMDTNVR
ncbi:MAG: DegT/DnrJ/EryC1/StrS family aminotransferase [Verrucomicrobiaceae bacterium]|nr:DegT/DnrJ/EryC1/StrS family aminotransferase [Verrucomicrobiaceae bacterium]